MYINFVFNNLCNTKEPIFILGNESSDMDSVFSSLFLAYFKYLETGNPIYVPLV